MERGLKNYLEELRSDISSLVYSDGEGASFEDKYTEHCLEILDGIGKSEGSRVLSYVHPNSSGGIDWKINGYCLKDQFKDENNKIHFETLDLFITYFKNNDFEYNITTADFDKSLNQIKKFLNASLKRQIDYIDPSHIELYELIKIIGKQNVNFDRINIFFLINGSSKQDVEKIAIKGFEELDIFVQVWDIMRFYKIYETNSVREPIEIDFSKIKSQSNSGLQCLKVPSIDELYDCYLAIVPGDVLAALYKEFSNELLESNVRAFLGQTGKFNKGIRDTIRDKPHMFLPYNNGITATAETVETELINGQLFITKLNDFQIVNGGQTTASLFHTQKKYKDVDLDKIFVQMKLTVIKDTDQKNIEVPNIARFANSQNKVTELDLSSNNPYFVQIESLSRKKYVINPENRNQSVLWYFERVNGQYRESLNKLTTPVQQRKFKEQNPTSQKFVKSDVAKYINLWELEPHFVSLGAQKNFIHYTKKINDLVKRNKLPGDNFYKKLIANAILFKTVDKLFGRKNVDAIGDTNLKSFTVAYTVSYFHYLTSNQLDLWKIYEEQKIDSEILNVLRGLLSFVYDHLIRSANNTLLSEYAKKESSWNLLKQENCRLDLNQLSQFLVTREQLEEREKEKEIDINELENSIFTVSQILSLGLRFWDGFKVHIANSGNYKDLEFDVWDLLKKIKENKNLDVKGIRIGKTVMELIESRKIDIEEIKSLSLLPDQSIIDVKAIYDRLILLKKDEWSKIIALSEQTNIFQNLELANVKSIQRALLNKEKVKESSLIKANESLKKLEKFGIKVT